MNGYGNSAMEMLMERFAPLIRKTARRYEGRGAEVDDLEQEGRLALMQIAAGCIEDDLVARIARRLPSMVRDAAERMTRRGRPCREARTSCVSLSEPAGAGSDVEIADTIEDEGASRRVESIETAVDIEGVLSDVEMRTARSLACGMTYDDIARREGVSRQAISNRVRKMRRKLGAIL